MRHSEWAPQGHSLKPRCLMGICVFVKYVFWSTYSQNHKPVVSNAARSRGIACEGRIVHRPEVRVASKVLPAAALPEHWWGFLEVSAAGCWVFLVQMKHCPAAETRPGGLWEPFSSSYRVLEVHPQERQHRHVRYRPHFETHGCPSHCIWGKTRYKNACSAIRTEGQMNDWFIPKSAVRQRSMDCFHQLKEVTEVRWEVDNPQFWSFLSIDDVKQAADATAVYSIRDCCGCLGPQHCWVDKIVASGKRAMWGNVFWNDCVTV